MEKRFNDQLVIRPSGCLCVVMLVLLISSSGTGLTAVLGQETPSASAGTVGSVGSIQPMNSMSSGAICRNVAIYQQCGGLSVPTGTGAKPIDGPWAGFCCAPGNSCKYSSKYYRQCLPGGPTPNPVPHPSPHSSPKPGPRPPSIPHPSGSVSSYNYGQVLGLSWLFYETQQTGVLPTWNRHRRALPGGFRGNSYLQDGSTIGRNLSGGWFDAGDHGKFGLPFGWSVAVLAWGVLENEQAYRGTKQWTIAKQNIGFAVNWMVRAHTSASDDPAKNVYVCQVGDVDADHKRWCRPEDYLKPDCTAPRTVSLCSSTRPCSNIVGNAAAAMAAYAIILRRDDPASTEAVALLDRAKQLYWFGRTFPGGWRIATGTNPYQGAANRGEDEMLLAAAMLCKAIGTNSFYCTQEAVTRWGEAVKQADSTAAGGDWDNAFNIAMQVLLSAATNSPLHAAWRQREMTNLDKWHVTTPCTASTRDGVICYSPKGVAHIQTWAPLRHSANAAAIKLAFAKYVGDATEARKHRCWAKRQINFMLGNFGRSFVVGFGKSPPTHAHHRAASCPKDPSIPCGWDNFNSLAPNPSGPVGALVGGPDRLDKYMDVRDNFVANEVAIDYNAGFTSAIATLTELSARLRGSGVSWDSYCSGAAMPSGPLKFA